MTKKSRYLATAALLVVATAAIAAPTMLLNDGLAKVTAVTRNGFSFSEPAGGSAEVPTVFVFSDNKVGYSRIGYNDKRLHFDLRATQACGGGKWSEEGAPTVKIGDQSWPNPVHGKPLKIGDNGWRPILDVLRENIDFDAKLRAVERCNQVITDYTSQGELPAGLLQKGFWIKVEASIPATMTAGCKYHPSKKGIFDEPPQLAPSRDFMLSTWVRCMPTGYVVTQGVPSKPGKHIPEPFADINLHATNSGLSRVCPATIVFKGSFKANRALKGNYRLIGSDGYESPSYPFNLSGGFGKAVSWQRRVEVPSTMGSLTTGGGGSWPRTVEGWLQLEVLADENNAKPHRSPRAAYRVFCQNPATPPANQRLKNRG